MGAQEMKITYGDDVFELARSFVVDRLGNAYADASTLAKRIEESHSLARAIQAAIDTWFDDNKGSEDGS